MTRWYPILILAFSVACSGANNDPIGGTDSGVSQSDSGTAAEDTGATNDDMGTGEGDTGTTSSDMGTAPDMTAAQDMATGLTFGEVCTMIERTEEPECDVPAQTGCPADAVCQVLFVASEMRPRPACTNANPDATIAHGEACGGAVNGSCVASANCYQQVCRSVCRLSDGAGCTEGQSCKLVDTSLEPFGLGLCLDAC